MDLFVGIDPGMKGACGVVTEDGDFRAVFELPIIRDMSLAWVNAKEFTDKLHQATAGDHVRAVFIERVSAMPKQGVASTFQFGVGFGSLLSLTQSLGYPLALVTAAKWKNLMKVTSDKKTSLARGQMMFPKAELTLVKHEARAEALLIAYYGLMQRKQGLAARAP